LAAVGDIRNELSIRVERLEACRGEILPRDHAWLARDDLRLGGSVSRNDRIGGDVAGLAEVLFQRGGHRAMDEERRQFELSHALRGAAQRWVRSRPLKASLAIVSASASVNKLRCASAGLASG